MKKKITYIVITLFVAIIVYILGTAQTESVKTELENVQDATTQVYNIDSENDMDSLIKALEHRNGKIIIEISNGTVIDDQGNGKDDLGYYRAYDTKQFSVGDHIQSVFVYNPENNYTDDILYRVDTLIDPNGGL